MKDLKKVLALVLIAVLAVGVLTACGGKKDAPADDAGDTEAAHYVISTDKGFSPFEFEDEDGNIVGIDMDILAAVAEDQGFTYDLHYIGWDAAIAECQAGQADGMIAGASITDERKENIAKESFERMSDDFHNYSNAFFDKEGLDTLVYTRCVQDICFLSLNSAWFSSYYVKGDGNLLIGKESCKNQVELLRFYFYKSH